MTFVTSEEFATILLSVSCYNVFWILKFIIVFNGIAFMGQLQVWGFLVFFSRRGVLAHQKA